MPVGELVVCESSGVWGVRLRRILRPDQGWRVVETRSAADCWEELLRNSNLLVAWEATRSHTESLVRHLLEQHERFPRAPSVVLCTRDIAQGAKLWREAGASHVVRSPRELACITRLARRHLQQYPTLPAAAQQPIWMRLPWGPSASDNIPSLASDPPRSV